MTLAHGKSRFERERGSVSQAPTPGLLLFRPMLHSRYAFGEAVARSIKLRYPRRLGEAAPQVPDVRIASAHFLATSQPAAHSRAKALPREA